MNVKKKLHNALRYYMKYVKHHDAKSIKMELVIKVEKNCVVQEKLLGLLKAAEKLGLRCSCSIIGDIKTDLFILKRVYVCNPNTLSF